MYGAVDRFGWVALLALRLLGAAALFAVLGLTLVRRRQPIAPSWSCSGLVVGLEVLLQDRPATVSLVFVALLGAACERLWVTGARPPPLLVAVACLLWAQLHGLWVLAPAAFALVALGALSTTAGARPVSARCPVCLGASLAGIVNPRGPVSFLLPVRFRDAAAGAIGEWGPTTFTITLTIAWGILSLFLILAWARSPFASQHGDSLVAAVDRVRARRRAECGPAILLTAPVVLRALERSAGPRLDRSCARPPRRDGPAARGRRRGSRARRRVPGRRPGADGPLGRTPALAIARRLAADPGPPRIWNGYNASGSPGRVRRRPRGHLRLVVDGRSDLWGGTYIAEVGAVASLTGGWEPGSTPSAPTPC